MSEIASPAYVFAKLLVQLEVSDEALEGAVWVTRVSTQMNDNRTVTTYDTPGTVQGRGHRTGKTYDHPGIQVRVKGIDYLETDGKVAQINAALDLVKNLLVEMDEGQVNVRVLAVSRKSGPVYLGQDELNRYDFSINYTVSLKAVDE